MGALVRPLLLLAVGAMAGCDLGDGEGTAQQPVTPTSEHRLAAGNFHSLAVDAEGRVLAWGSNAGGTLGTGSTESSPVPVRVPGLGGVVAVSAAAYNLALKADGKVWSWGWNESGYIGSTLIPFLCTPGYPNTGSVLVPAEIVGLEHVVQVSAGPIHAAVLKADGTVWTWGSNTVGQLGTGIAANNSCLPQQVPGLTGITAISAGANHTLALRNDGTVWAWGYNGNGSLGNGTLLSSNVPVQVVGLNGVLAIAAAGQSVALKSDGSVWAWGSNQSGEVGNDSAQVNCSPDTGFYFQPCVKQPVKIEGVSGVVKVAAGEGTTFAMTGQGQVWGWGNSRALGTTQSTATCGIAHVSWPCVRMPLRLPEKESFQSIARGSGHALALKPDGSVWSWGGNFDGQLGDGSHTDSTETVRVVGPEGQGWLNINLPWLGEASP